jgi:hypothetical protein
MQGILGNLDEPFAIRQDTDTVTPREQIPIYLIHPGIPFCSNPHCFCQRGKRAGAALYHQIAAGKLLLAQLATGIRKTTVEAKQGIHETCELYGHTWQETKQPDVKECSLCHVRGYCPTCTPLAPAGTTAFYCTSHTGRQVQ